MRESITRLNNFGDKTEPCLMPLPIQNDGDRCFPSLNLLVMLLYQLWISRQHFPFTPALNNSFSRTQNSTVSKALSRSKNWYKPNHLHSRTFSLPRNQRRFDTVEGQLIMITCAIINVLQLFSPLYPAAFF